MEIMNNRLSQSFVTFLVLFSRSLAEFCCFCFDMFSVVIKSASALLHNSCELCEQCMAERETRLRGVCSAEFRSL